MLLFLISCALTVGLSILQTTSAVIFFGIKPNFVFALFVVIAGLEKDWLKRIAIVLLSLIMIRFTPSISWFDLIFVSTSLLIFALVDYLPWKSFITSIASVVIGTAIIEFSYHEVSRILLEILMNSVIVVLFLGIFKLTNGKKEISKKNRF